MTTAQIVLGIVGFIFTAFLIVVCALRAAYRNAPYWDERNREFVDEDTIKARNAKLFNAAKNIK